MSKGHVIDGKAVAAKVRADVAKQVDRLKREHGLTPGLAVVLVGDNPASKVYVKNKAAQTVEVGMHSIEHKLSAETPRPSCWRSSPISTATRRCTASSCSCRCRRTSTPRRC